MSRTAGSARQGVRRVLFVALCAAACSVSSDTLGPEVPSFIELAPARATVAVGEAMRLTAVTPVDDLVWTTSAGAIATVNGEGTVAGVAPGTATITVRDAFGNSASMVLRVGDRDVIWREVWLGHGGHACGLATDGRAFCWGDAFAGRLGNGVRGGPPGPTSVTYGPLPVSGGMLFASLSAGERHTCGVTNDGRAFCWGSGADGVLGNGTAGDAATPVEVAGGLAFWSVSAGGSHTCGVTDSGVAYCWGANESGQLGTGSRNPSSVPVAVVTGATFASVAAGRDATCGVTTVGEVYCWGSGEEGQLGNGATVDASEPVLVSGDLTFASVSVGATEACAITVVFSRYCWGTPLGLQEGMSDLLQTTPTEAPGSFQALSVGAVAGCGIDPRGVAFCWWPELEDVEDIEGGQFARRIVDGRGNDILQPQPVAGGHQFQSISTGNLSACAVASTGRAYCWGRADGGILGNGATKLRRAPAPIQVSDPVDGV